MLNSVLIYNPLKVVGLASFHPLCEKIPYMKAYITIKLFATLKKYLPASDEHYPINPGVSVGELLDELQIPISMAKLIFINGKQGDSDTVLKHGDRIGIFPPVGGG